jgi:DNA-binding response OmpR family regulator
MKQGKHVILCIDDDPDFLESMRAIIESNGYLMESADTAEAGLRRYDEVKPDLVIVDLMMEEIDSGVSFVRDLKARGVKVPIYMLTSVGDALNTTIDYAQLGLTGVLQKPINPDLLARTLKAKLK